MHEFVLARDDARSIRASFVLKNLLHFLDFPSTVRKGFSDLRFLAKLPRYAFQTRASDNPSVGEARGRGLKRKRPAKAGDTGE